MRNNLGLDPANSIGGAIPIDVTGRVGVSPDRDGRFSVVADLTSAQIDGFLPGWVKQSGKPARATFTRDHQPAIRPHRRSLDRGRRRRRERHHRARRLRRAAIGRLSRPTVFRTAITPASRSTRTPDGVLHAVMRGDAYDGRGFIKAMSGGPTAPQAETQAARYRSRHEARRRAGLQRRGAARSRAEIVAPRRRGPQSRPVRQDRPRWIAERRSARRGGRAASDRPRRAATPARCCALPMSIRAWMAAI